MVSRSVSYLEETKLALAALLHSLQIKINYREFHSNEGFKLIMTMQWKHSKEIANIPMDCSRYGNKRDAGMWMPLVCTEYKIENLNFYLLRSPSADLCTHVSGDVKQKNMIKCMLNNMLS